MRQSNFLCSRLWESQNLIAISHHKANFPYQNQELSEHYEQCFQKRPRWRGGSIRSVPFWVFNHFSMKVFVLRAEEGKNNNKNQENNIGGGWERRVRGLSWTKLKEFVWGSWLLEGEREIKRGTRPSWNGVNAIFIFIFILTAVS